MKLSFSEKTIKAISADIHVVLVSSQEFAQASAKKGRARSSKSGSVIAALEKEYGPHIRQRLAAEGFAGKHLESKLFRDVHQTHLPLLLLVAWSEAESKDVHEKFERCRKLGTFIADTSRSVKAARVALSAAGAGVGEEAQLLAIFEGLALSSYSFTRYKTGESKKPAAQLKELVILQKTPASKQSISQIDATISAVTRARDLVNLPPNDLRPSDFVRISRDVARKSKLAIEVFDQARLKKMGAGGIVGVGQASSDSSFLIKLTYKPKAKKGGKHPVITLVGKAITFDSGGLSIKPGSGMETMKCDMAGGAAVLSVLEALATIKPDVEVRGFIATAENMIDGGALRPGDIITHLNGKTVEVLNTDAEGRLVLADALTLAAREKPRAIVDLATLTGACVVALGGKYAGLFSNNDQLAERLSRAADTAGERLWRLPLAPEYRKMLKSPVADYKNSFGREGGAITAALFLEEFVSKVPWAHLDIAGPAFLTGDDGYLKRGGVGFGVRTLIAYLGSL